MKLVVSSKYITLPVNTKVSAKKITMYDCGELVYDLDCKVDMISPDFTAYVDVSRFIGKTLDIEISTEMDFRIGTADKMDIPDLYKEKYRPQIHFTVANGWNNDPNGLVFHNGTYHMFFQYNPCSTEWGNMHWGHAESSDLIHWEEKDIALYPDHLGTMYSGCGFEDKNNVSGLGTEDNPPLLFFYTAAGARCLLSKVKTSSQCLAYSTDNGKTLIKHENNPIVKTMTPSNRDPKVVYVDEIGKYVMALYLEGSRYCLLSSNNLVNWDKMHDFYLDGDSECPDIYPLICDGEKKWVISGASDMYRVGHFENDAFVFETDTKRLTYSKVSYAAQSFVGIEGRVVRASWNRIKIPEARFSQQMGVFTEMSLCNENGEYYLLASPINEYETLRTDKQSFDGEMSSSVRFDNDSAVLDINIKAEYADGIKYKLDLFGEILTVDTKENLLKFKDVRMPVSLNGNAVDLRIITDKASVEIFADGGRYSATVMNLYDENLPRVILSSDNANAKVKAECYSLASMYNE